MFKLLANTLATILFVLLTGCGGGGGGGSGTITPAITLSSITIALPVAIVSKGGSTNLVATGRYSDGTTSDISSQVTWASSNSGIVSINSSGVATGVAGGNSAITASLNSITSNSTSLQVLAAPIGLFAVSGTNQVTVSWSPVTIATSYNIYWGTTPGITSSSTKITGATSPYVQTSLASGSTYYYRISALYSGIETLSDEIFSFIYTGGNPAGLFSSTGSMTAQIIARTATLLPNGDVLFAGGRGNTANTVATAELYDPSTGLFSGTGNMTSVRERHSATLLPNGKVLIAGGGINGTNTVLATAELYDPLTGLFTATKGSMTTPRAEQTATLLPNGKVNRPGFRGGCLV